MIYEENHSFDNLYGSWEGINGVANADAARSVQVNQTGSPFTCLKQTTSVLATIERRFGLVPLTTRDAAIRDLSTVYEAKNPFGDDRDDDR